jgi:hypothetical protein
MKNRRRHACNNNITLIHYVYFNYKHMILLVLLFYNHQIHNTLNKLRVFSPPANYTDRATAACRRS